MKVLSNFRFLFMVAAVSFMLVSCGEDLGDGGGTTTQTTLSATTASETTIALGNSFSINLSASAGEDAMNTIEVFEDGVSIDRARISYDGVQASANPRLLFDNEKTTLNELIEVVGHMDVGTRNYTFTIADDAGDTESVAVDVTTIGDPPVLTLDSPTVQPLTVGTLNSVRLTATKGAGLIASIGVLVDGVSEDIADLSFGGDFTSNPHLLEGALAEGFSMESLGFRAPATEGTYLYTITITDEFGQESVVEFTANVGPVATPLVSLMGVLFNSLGPAGTGGLDLDNGMSTGTQMTDTDAEIRDQGADANGNWAQLIAPMNGSRLFLVRPGMDGVSENFAFGDISSKEILSGLIQNGYELAVSGTVVKDQVYLVERDGQNYAFQVAEVNVISADNSDNYVLNIVK